MKVATSKPTSKTNPYNLVWYQAGWSEKKTTENNKKYWLWEIKHNGFKCP